MCCLGWGFPCGAQAPGPLPAAGLDLHAGLVICSAQPCGAGSDQPTGWDYSALALRTVSLPTLSPALSQMLDFRISLSVIHLVLFTVLLLAIIVAGLLFSNALKSNHFCGF